MQENSETSTQSGSEDKEGFYVSPKLDCPHEPSLNLDKIAEAINDQLLKTPCKGCSDLKENWLCLECLEVFCSRYVNSHMAEHNQQVGHSIAFSLSDASFWCYSCDSYIYSNNLRIISSKFSKVKHPNANKDKDALAQQLANMTLQEKEGPVEFTREDLIKGLKENKFKSICFMTGAGISVAAGIPDFRTPGTGLYSKVQNLKLPYPEAIFSLDYLQQKPEAFFTLSKGFLDYKASPVQAHYFIKKIHDDGNLMLSYTQNIDGLEHEAGVPLEKMVEAHGHMRSAHCIECCKKHSMEEFFKYVNEEKVFYCDCEKKGVVKPDIIFFGEKLPNSFFSKFEEVSKADLVFVMGTSLKVFPFASLLTGVKKTTPLVLVNYENPGVKRDNFLFLQGPIEDSIISIMKDVGWELAELKKN